MSTAKFDTLSNLAGTQTVPVATVAQGSAKAWVNFNGTGTVAIRASFNVSSITDNGTGIYTVNLTTAMPDANYSFAPSIGETPIDCVITVKNVNTSNIQVYSYRIPTGAAIDASFVSIAIFR